MCLPSGLQLSAAHKPPHYACFVLTLRAAAHVRHCLTVHERPTAARRCGCQLVAPDGGACADGARADHRQWRRWCGGRRRWCGRAPRCANGRRALARRRRGRRRRRERRRRGRDAGGSGGGGRSAPRCVCVLSRPRVQGQLLQLDQMARADGERAAARRSAASSAATARRCARCPPASSGCAAPRRRASLSSCSTCRGRSRGRAAG